MASYVWIKLQNISLSYRTSMWHALPLSPVIHPCLCSHPLTLPHSLSLLHLIRARHIDLRVLWLLLPVYSVPWVSAPSLTTAQIYHLTRKSLLTTFLKVHTHAHHCFSLLCVFVFWCCKRIPENGYFIKNRDLFLMVLEAEKSMCMASIWWGLLAAS
jgi:hypothetical protein